jgi:energy-converting hydrogenase B subunit D
MTALQAIALVLVALSGTALVAIREPERQIPASGVFGICLALLFFTFQAPDVALSQLAVGAVALPAMLTLALRRVRRHEEMGAEPEEEAR